MWFFNPGFEASLRGEIVHYTPPLSVQRFRHDLASLPSYLAEPEDFVLVPEDFPEVARSAHMVSHFSSSDSLMPWGWAPELEPLFSHDAKFPYTREEMRSWGSRHLSLLLWRAVRQQSINSFLETQEPIVHEGDSKVLPENGRWVVKEEFSSSGRGVHFCSNIEQLTQFFASLREGKQSQRYYIEPWYQLLEDRGYEFIKNTDGTIHYLGASAFVTKNGKYLGNQLLSPEELEGQWSLYDTTPSHEQYISYLTNAIAQLPLDGYTGLLGVDTAVYLGSDGNKYLLPCLEINMRPTMGHIALSLSKRYLQPYQSGYFFISSDVKSVTNLTTQVPLYLQEKRALTAGNYPLTPLFHDTSFAAFLRVEDRKR